MKRILMLALCAGPALAQGAGPDADGDGLVSYDELVAAYPDVTEAVFLTIDADADGVLTAEEMEAAVEAGLLPEMEEG